MAYERKRNNTFSPSVADIKRIRPNLQWNVCGKEWRYENKDKLN